MNEHKRNDPKKSGYPEEQPRKHDGHTPASNPAAPHEPQNVPDKKPQPSP